MKTTAMVYAQAETFGALAAELEAISGRMAKAAITAPISASHAVEVVDGKTIYTAIVIFDLDLTGVDVHAMFDKQGAK